MVMPGGRDPSVQSLVGDLTGFLRRNLPQQRPPMPASRPMPSATGMDPEGLGRALLGPNASPEEIQRMLAAIAGANANDPSVNMAGNLAGSDPMLARLNAMPTSTYSPPKPAAPHWTQGVGEKTYPLGRPTHEVAGMTLGAASLPFLPLASPVAGAIGGGLGGLGSSVYNGARTPTEAFLGGAVPGAMMGLAGAGAHRMLRGAEPMPSTEILEPDLARRPTAQSPLMQPAGMPRGPRMLGDDPLTEMGTPPMPRMPPQGQVPPGMENFSSTKYDNYLNNTTGWNGRPRYSASRTWEPPSDQLANLADAWTSRPEGMSRNYLGRFDGPHYSGREVYDSLQESAGLPQPSLLSRFEGEMARTQPGSPIADDMLRGMDPGDWFSKTQPGVGTAQRLEGAIPQQDRIMEMLRRQAPNPMMQPAGMPDPDGLRAFFQALSGLRGR